MIDGKEKDDVFSCGANVIMRKVTPDAYKQKLYEIYPAASRTYRYPRPSAPSWKTYDPRLWEKYRR